MNCIPGGEKRVIVYTPKELLHWYFQFVDALVHSFRSFGCDTSFIDQPDYLPADPVVSTLLLIVANPGTSAVYKIRDTSAHPLYNLIVYETEAVGHDLRRCEVYDWLSPKAIFTYCYSNVAFIKSQRSLPAYYVPPGYSTVYDYRNHARTPQTVSDQPVSFISWDYERRIGRLHEFSVRVKNIKAWTHDDYALKVCGHHILINIHKHGVRSVEMFRLAPALSSGLRVISEEVSSDDHKALDGLVDFVPVNEMPDLITSLQEEARNDQLRNKERKRISGEFKDRFDLNALIRGALDDLLLFYR